MLVAHVYFIVYFTVILLCLIPVIFSSKKNIINQKAYFSTTLAKLEGHIFITIKESQEGGPMQYKVFCYILGVFTDNSRVILSSMMPSIAPPTRKSRRKDFNLKLSRQLVRARMGQMVYRPHLDDLVKEALQCKYGITRPQREVARAVHHLPGRRRKLCIITGSNNRTHNTCYYCGVYRCRNCSTISYSCSNEMQCLQRRQ